MAENQPREKKKGRPVKEKKKGRPLGRRVFLIGSAAVVGGVAFGIYRVRQPHPNPLLPGLKDGEAAITPFVKIDAEGVTLITPRADKGQGSLSLQAHLIAEELDVDPQTVKLDFGQPAPAYYNTAMADGSAPFPGWNQSWTAETMRSVMDVPMKLMGVQMTGGSTTTPDMFVRMREAGAVARETLKRAASDRTGVAVAELKTDNGAVLLPDGQRLAYEELAPDAAKIPAVTDVKLRDPSAWRFLGKKMQRVDMLAKSTGRQQYGIDLRFEGMLHATVRTNPGLGGEMTRYDATRAEAMRGVKKIAPITHGVAVIADNTWRAFRAANAVELEWGPAQYASSSAEMWEILEAAIGDPEKRDSRMRDDGDVDAVHADGEVLSAEYRVPYVNHAPMEPMNATVLATDDRLDIWTGTQIPAFIQQHAADLTGLPLEAVFVHNQTIGGSFGRRLEDTYAMQAVETALLVKGTAVKMTWSREEDMTHDYPKPMQLGRVRGTVKNGRVQSLDLDTASGSLARSWLGRLFGSPPPGPDSTLVLGAFDQPYGIPDYRVSGYVAERMVPISSWRAPGANNNSFFQECFLDELIAEAGADPLEERLRICVDDTSRKVLEALGELSGWRGAKLGPNRGRGLAFAYSHGVPAAEVVDVALTEDGSIRIDRVFAVADVGQVVDPVNLEAQLTGAIVFGLGAAMNCELTYENYAAQQTNYHAHEGMRLHQTPEIVTRVLENQSKIRGAGEPTLPPAAPALANAIFAATGQRIRELPLHKSVRFV